MSEIKIRGIDESLKQYLIKEAKDLYFSSLNAFLVSLLEEYQRHNGLLPYQVEEEKRQAQLGRIIEKNTEVILKVLAHIKELNDA